MRSGGFIEIALAIIILLVILSLFGFSLAGIFENQQLKENFIFIWDWLKSIWDWIIQNTFTSARELISGYYRS